MKTTTMLVGLGLILVGLTSLTSCSKYDEQQMGISKNDVLQLSEEEYISIAFDNPKEISATQAIQTVQEFAKNSMTRSSQISPIVEKKYYINNLLTRSKLKGAISIPVYQIKLSNKVDGGFALVSGDERCPSVIAFIEKGSLSDTISNKAASMMIKNSEAATARIIYHYEYLKDSLRIQTLNKLHTAFHSDLITYDDVKEKIVVKGENLTRGEWIPQPETGTLIREVEPLLQTEWGQSSPFNNELGSIQNGKEKVMRQVGCVGTAIAQIVAHYEAIHSVYGHTLNWPLIKERYYIDSYTSTEVKQQVAYLCKHVAYGIKTEWHAEDGSGGANFVNARSYLETMGLTFDLDRRNRGYDMYAPMIIASLDNKYPVLVGGDEEKETRSTDGKNGGHCWILDGYQIRRRPISTMLKAIIKKNDVYIHANFGWKGYESGYYMVDRNDTYLTFQTAANGNYNKNLHIYPRVRRK